MQNQLYMAGESYAGHWIPAFAKMINANQADPNVPLLNGIMIGDGLT
jgi:carboxypeptidase C (cathepsin A)